MLVLTLVSVSLFVIIGVGLYYKSIPLLQKLSWGQLLTSSTWKPLKGLFGFLPVLHNAVLLWVTGYSHYHSPCRFACLLRCILLNMPLAV